MKNQKGFTLIELLVALSIVAVLVTILYETFNAVLRSTEQVDESTEIDQMARIALGLISRELRSAYWRPPDSSGQTSSPFVFAGVDDESGGQPSDTLEFTALTYSPITQSMADPSLSLVQYDLVYVPETETSILMHREQNHSVSVDDFNGFELAERVRSLNFRYFDGQEWREDWSAADQNKLPRAVEIDLLFKDASGRERRFITQTDIPVGQTS